jgi:hypothetical protein
VSLIKYYTKGILSNRNLWFWGVAIMLFWLVLGAYTFSQGLPQNALSGYTASWYGTITLYSLSSLAITVAYSIYFSGSSLVYSFKYTKLTPMSYTGSLLCSSSVLGVILSAIMLISTYAFYSAKFGLNLSPSDPLGALGISALAGIFMMAFAMLLVLIVVNYMGLRSINLVSFIPLILAFGLGFTGLLSELPTAFLYASPYNAIQMLLFNAYSGSAATMQLDNSSSPALYWPYLLVSLAIWTVFLITADSVLLRKLKPRQLEEGRQI